MMAYGSTPSNLVVPVDCNLFRTSVMNHKMGERNVKIFLVMFSRLKRGMTTNCLACQVFSISTNHDRKYE